jgi:translation initiation factor 3 subunit A
MLQVKYNIVQCVYPELQNLYQWIEVEFNPLKLASRVQSSLDFISKKDELVQYTSALQDVTVMRIVKQASDIVWLNQSIKFHLSQGS